MNVHVAAPDGARPDNPVPRILIVDDATVVRLYYRQILERAGYLVEEAINGIEGLEQAVQSSFDLCIVDINMPMMDGYSMLHALRREPITQALPVLMTSSEAGPDDRRAALQAGANAYLIKPVAQDTLALYAAAMLGRSAT